MFHDLAVGTNDPVAFIADRSARRTGDADANFTLVRYVGVRGDLRCALTAAAEQW